MAGRSRTGGGTGTNQYRVRGQAKQVAVPTFQADATVPPRIRCGEMWNTHCSVWIHAPDWSHGKHPSATSLDDAASSDNTPASVLDALSRSELSYIRKGVARNPNTSLSTLQQLAQDNHDYVRAALLTNPHATSEVLHIVLKRLPPNMMSQHERTRLVTHPNADAEMLDGLVCDPDVHIQQQVSQHPHFSPEHVGMIADPRRYGDHLAAVSTHRYPLFRALVARNAQTRPQDILGLAADPYPQVRATAAGNYNLPAEGAEMLSNDDFAIRLALAGNFSVTPTILLKLADSPNPNMQRQLVHHPNLPGSVLAKMVKSHDNCIYRKALSHPNCPTETLEREMSNSEWDRRLAVARNAACPPEVLVQLLRDTSVKVHTAAAENPNVPPHMRAILMLGHRN